MKFIKRYLIWVVLAGILFFLLSYHIILINSSVILLKKSSLSLNYTFFNAKGKEPYKILSIDILRDDGIGDILVERGKISEEKLERLTEKFDAEDE